jgi:molecular chaperone GrpE
MSNETYKTNTPSDFDGTHPAPSGADVHGGDLTNPQDADAANTASVESRAAEQDYWAKQQAGEIGAQTMDFKPSAGNPESGMPGNPTGTENSGGTSGQTGEKDNDANAPEKKTVAGDEAVDTIRPAMENDERFLRLAADFENYKRQAARRESETRDRATRSVLEDLLPVLDNFERAVDAARNAKDVDSVRIGVEFIAQQFRDALKNHGVEPIPAQGQKFDPLLHDALEEVSDSGVAEGTVIDEAQRGYSFKGTVLRPSRVRVAGK